MPYLVDGSNLGGRLGGAAGARDPVAVVRLLLPWARRRGRVELYFDGSPCPAVARRYGPLLVRWTERESADDRILARLGDGARDWIVVTDDRVLAAAARARGARTLGMAELLERIPPGEGEGATEPAVDLDSWWEYFGLERE